MSPSSRPLIAVLVAGSLSLMGPTFAAGPAGAHAESGAKVSAAARRSEDPRPGDLAQSFLNLMNEERSGAGLPALTTDPALAGIAQAWSTRMAASGGLAHNPSLRDQVAPGWQRLAENVGAGPDVEVLHDMFMASAGHRRNVLGGFDRIGVGVVMADGRIWVTVDFLKS